MVLGGVEVGCKSDWQCKGQKSAFSGGRIPQVEIILCIILGMRGYMRITI
jgi:hypothetical protein